MSAALSALLKLQVETPISDPLAANLLAVLTTQLHPRLRLDYGLLEIERRLEFMNDLVLLDARGDDRAALAAAERLREDATLVTAFPHMTSAARPLRRQASREH